MRAKLKTRLREQLDQGLADIELSLHVAVLTAAGYRGTDVQRKLGIGAKEVRDAIQRLKEAESA
jgi:DNA-binding NtrC family response regulator